MHFVGSVASYLPERRPVTSKWNLAIPAENIYLSSTYQHQSKADENHCPDGLGHIHGRVGAQTIKRVLHKMFQVYLFESEAAQRPEESAGLKPHLVKDKMHKRAKGDSKEPSLIMAAVEIKPGKGNENEKQEGMAKYPAAAEGMAEEDMSQRFINYVGKKRANEQEPQVYSR